MADKASIAIMREQALRRLQGAMQRIGEVTGVEPVTLLESGRDPAYLEAQRLEAFAAYADRLANAITDAGLEPQAPDYDAETVEDLERELAARGIDLSAIEGSGTDGNVVKSDLVAALEAADDAARKRAEWQETLAAMTHAQLDEQASAWRVTWPDEGSGKAGALVKEDKVSALMAAYDAEANAATDDEAGNEA